MTSRVRLVTNLPCLFLYSTLAWFPSWLQFTWLNAFQNVAGTDDKHWGLSLKWIKSSLEGFRFMVSAGYADDLVEASVRFTTRC